MRDFFRKFMEGRYGIDQMGRSFIIIGIILSISGLFIKNHNINLFIIFLSNGLLIYTLFRAFSRDINRRYKENIAFIKATKPIRREIDVWKLRHRDRKTHRYVRCPQCRNYLRTPKNLGKIKIRCNHCGNVFYKRV